MDEAKQYKVYEVVENFSGYDDRHMAGLAKGQILVGLKEFGDWVFGIPDENPDQLGFVPKTCLQFKNEIQR